MAVTYNILTFLLPHPMFCFKRGTASRGIANLFARFCKSVLVLAAVFLVLQRNFVVTANSCLTTISYLCLLPIMPHDSISFNNISNIVQLLYGMTHR